MTSFKYKVEDLTPKLKVVIWKITLNCNFLCKHCGFSAGNVLPDELTTSEAVYLCHQLREAECEEVVLSGGEPLTRKDWPIIASTLSSLGIKVGMVSNGYLISERNILKIIDNGISRITLSVDGMRGNHDLIRKKGSFDRVVNAIKLCRKHELDVGVITTISKFNIGDLDEMFYLFQELKPKSWQIQLADGIGYMDINRSNMLAPEDLVFVESKLIEIYKKNELEFNSNLILSIGDNLGYFTELDDFYRKGYVGSCYTGCFAGVYLIGIESNGDVKGCPTLSNEYIEGNVRDLSISRIFFSNEKFLYNRTFDDSRLSGDCLHCSKRKLCRGGCMASRLGGGHGLTENHYCLKRVKDKIKK